MNDLAPSEWIMVPPDEQAPPVSAFADEVISRSPDEHHWLEVVDLTPHWRSLNPDWDGSYGPDDDHWEIDILHPEACALRGPKGEPGCGVAWLIEDLGLREAMEIVPEVEGRWRFKFVSGRDSTGDGFANIEWIDDPEKPGLPIG